MKTELRHEAEKQRAFESIIKLSQEQDKKVGSEEQLFRIVFHELVKNLIASVYFYSISPKL